MLPAITELIMETGIHQMSQEEQDIYIDTALFRLGNYKHELDSGISSSYFEKKTKWANIRSYYKLHPEEKKAYLSKYHKKRYANNPSVRLNSLMSSGIWHSLKNGSKDGVHWEKLVDFTLSDLKEHLESLFTDGMTWENQGAWHIDHLKPVSSFTFTNPKDEDFKLCFALSNLQPLWAKDNLEKSNKIDIKYNNL